MAVRAALERWRGRRRRARVPAGVNVVGYFGSTSGLADRAGELVACLRAVGTPVSQWTIPTDGTAPTAASLYDTTIAVVTAVQLASARSLVPEPFDVATRTIGYFFWELAQVPDEQQWGIGLVDEIWTPTAFVRDAYRSATARPVRLMPLPIAEPTRSERDRESFGFGDETVFLTSFDFLSSMQRKNPVGAIAAFRRAFPTGDEAVRLVVKSINAESRPHDRASLAVTAGDDERIELRDEPLSAGDQAALIAAADVYVSLHRSEGLGLHLAEAMWLRTAVLATAYSGSQDLVACADPRPVAALVSHRIVPVTGGGEAYVDGEWAEPDLDAAAASMRRLVDDPAWRADLAVRARAHMEHQADRRAAGDRVRSALADGQ